METENNREGELEERGLLMGYRGESIMDSGYFFAPYVPLTQTPTIELSDLVGPNIRDVIDENKTFEFDWREEGF